MTTPLRNGVNVEDRRLDRLVQFDDRSRLHPITAVLPPVADKLRSYTWRLDYWLDQGQEGRCVEFSICHELLARPVVVDKAKVDEILAHKAIYYPAQQIDIYPGGSYPGASPVEEGTSVLAGIKIASELGFYKAYKWAFGIKQLVMALGYAGPAVLGINWYESMFDTDDQGWIKVEGDIAGGHAILAQGVHLAFKTRQRERSWANLDLDTSYVLLHNSWGINNFGINGCGKISLNNLDRLLREDGECCLPQTRSKG
jgi:hypothetical protein